VTGWVDTIWLTKQLRIDKDLAVFGEFEFDFTEQLTGTVGLRYFDSENSLKGFFGFNDGYSSNQTYGEGYCNSLPQPPNTFNGAVFSQVWDDFQFSLLGANGLTEINNAGAAQIDGIEMDVKANAPIRPFLLVPLRSAAAPSQTVLG
jgi:outer membrane receptor protein involved in Fe transport